MENEEEKKEEKLSDWIENQYRYLKGYAKNSIGEDNFDYFNWIGIHLTSFTIFETAMNYFFKDFVNNFKTQDSQLKLINLPVNVIDIIFKDIDHHGEVLTLIKKDSLDKTNTNEKKVLSKLEKYFQFTHFNSNDSNNAELKTGILFDKPDTFLLSNSETGRWFQDLEIKMEEDPQEILLGTRSESISAHTFIDSYSSRIRHIIAHRIPDTSQLERAKIEFPVERTIDIFEQILFEMNKRYEDVHHHEILIPTNIQNLLQNMQ